MTPRILFALLCAFATPAFSQTSYAPSAAPEQDGVKFQLARTGKEVMIVWQIPADLDVKRFEIYRNTQNDVKGRGRAAAIRTVPAIYIDQVADESLVYWYWLKITLADERILNIGPLPTPEAKVWTP